MLVPQRDVVLSQEPKAAEKLFVDWVAETIRIHERPGMHGPMYDGLVRGLGRSE
jgi:hypothetical protein